MIDLHEEERGRTKRPRVDEDWKQEVREELEAMSEDTNIYVVINAWEPEGTDYILSEIVDMEYYETFDKAWGRLLNVAEAYGHDLMDSEVGFPLPPVPGITFQEYYIEELARG